jgi:hypothetical protein
VEGEGQAVRCEGGRPHPYGVGEFTSSEWARGPTKQRLETRELFRLRGRNKAGQSSLVGGKRLAAGMGNLQASSGGPPQGFEEASKDAQRLLSIRTKDISEFPTHRRAHAASRHHPAQRSDKQVRATIVTPCVLQQASIRSSLHHEAPCP